MHAVLPAPLLWPFEGVQPSLRGPLAHAGAGSAILGKVHLGRNAHLRSDAVLRADGHTVRVGDDYCMGVHSTVHISHALHGTEIGDLVTVGDNSVVHACTLGDACVIEDRVCVLDAAVVGSGCVVAQGSVVYSRSTLAPDHWCEGIPARAVRPLLPGELQAARRNIRERHLTGPVANAAPVAVPLASGAGWVAATVRGAGKVEMALNSSLWFGCTVEAPAYGVSIEAGANVQDNSVLRGSQQCITVGTLTTVGHNVELLDCSVGARSLIGMGSVLAPMTRVENDVLLAAGSTTLVGQVLESGWLWGGRPARPIARLDERKLQLIAQSASVYQAYAREYSATQRAALANH
jgi:carbonic anhydrase/acetyltransferase-like protein (isoleucine patch superfamily)